MEPDVTSNPLSSCSIGRQLNDICHKTSYVKTQDLHSFSSYSNDIQEILCLRTKCVDIHNVCYHHEQVYISKYSHLFGQTCCDPLQRQCLVKKSLRNITIDRARYSNGKLIPGRKMCRQCENLLAASEEGTTEQDDCDLYIPVEDKEEVLNQSFSVLGESPLKKQKLGAEKCVSYGEKKVEKMSIVVRETLASVLHVNADDLSEDKCTNCSNKFQDSVDLQDILCALQQKFQKESTSTSEKIQILTLTPQSWTIENACKFYGTTKHMVKKARKVKQEKGPLGIPDPKKASCTLPEHVLKDVQAFYESPDVSRICPGKKDYVTVRKPGCKQQKQKHLVLCNLKEAYVLFKTEHSDHKIGFSKFADLRPKWCVLAGSTGTHSVCVCMIHQNVKLMLESMKQSVKLSISKLLSHYVCDINNEACMLGHCLQCPLQSSFEEFLHTFMDDNEEKSEVTFRQWVNTDRSTLISMILSIPDFKTELLSKMKALAKHHYIAKTQSEYLKKRKTELRADECILLLDFSENFTFVVQDAIQGYHWENTQATLHPFVAYVQSDEKLKVISMCIISDCLTHDTVAVASFQKLVVPYLTAQYPVIKKIIYFSDGSSSQYKNKKNFLNLCHHKEDFKVHAEWHFFATSHGKSPCDGIGGTVKRSAYKTSLQLPYRNQIMSPVDLFNYCKTNLKNVKFFFVPELSVDKMRASLSERLASAVRIEGTRSYHSFVPTSDSMLLVSTVSVNTTNQTEVSAVGKKTGKELDVNNISIGSYVACMYDQKWWLGILLEKSVEEGDVQIQFMHPHGPCLNFYWPQNPDKCWVPHKNLLDTIPMPSAATATGRMFSVSNDTAEKIQYLMLAKNNESEH